MHFSDSVFNKMSRKDKYETNNRRQQTFMSAEDVASGRKSAWQGVEITGKCPTHNLNQQLKKTF